MALEIEAKFLLKDIPDTNYDDTLFITQFYTPVGRYRQTFSEKKDKTEWHVCNNKEISPGVNEEIESKVTFEIYKMAIESSTKVVRKRRYIKKTKTQKWEIDVFEDLYLVMAEIEVPTEEDLEEIEIPDWLKPYLLLEVTGNKDFNNFNLAVKV